MLDLKTFSLTGTSWSPWKRCAFIGRVWRIIVTWEVNKLKRTWLLKRQVGENQEYMLSLPGNEYGTDFMDICIGASQYLETSVWHTSTATSGSPHHVHVTDRMAQGRDYPHLWEEVGKLNVDGAKDKLVLNDWCHRPGKEVVRQELDFIDLRKQRHSKPIWAASVSRATKPTECS
jgi:hypothetical protein